MVVRGGRVGRAKYLWPLTRERNQSMKRKYAFVKSNLKTTLRIVVVICVGPNAREIREEAS